MDSDTTMNETNDTLNTKIQALKSQQSDEVMFNMTSSNNIKSVSKINMLIENLNKSNSKNFKSFSSATLDSDENSGGVIKSTMNAVETLLESENENRGGGENSNQSYDDQDEEDNSSNNSNLSHLSERKEKFAEEDENEEVDFSGQGHSQALEVQEADEQMKKIEDEDDLSMSSSLNDQDEKKIMKEFESDNYENNDNIANNEHDIDGKENFK